MWIFLSVSPNAFFELKNHGLEQKIQCLTQCLSDSVSVGWGINGGELSIIFIRKVSPTIFNIVLKRVFWGPTTLSVLHMLKKGLGFLEVHGPKNTLFCQLTK